MQEGNLRILKVDNPIKLQVEIKHIQFILLIVNPIVKLNKYLITLPNFYFL